MPFDMFAAIGLIAIAALTAWGADRANSNIDKD